METNKNIDRLLEIIDHPEAYSVQEILDIINHDKETRETYRWLMRAHRSCRHQHIKSHPADIDAAWRQFEQKHFALPKRHSPWFKAAAAFVGIVLITGIAWAATLAVRHVVDGAPQPSTEVCVLSPDQGDKAAAQPTLGDTTETATAATVVTFDNIPLDEMIDEIARHYGLTVEFRNEEARSLRFHFVWDQSDGLDKVLDDMGHFKSLAISQTGNRLIVQ